MLKRWAAGIVGIAAACLMPAAASAQCPAVGKGDKQFSINEGFEPDPIRQKVTAGGDLDLLKCGGVPGRGWVTKLPDFVVIYKAKNGSKSRETLTFRIESAADTVLLVNDPGNKWRWNDDGGKGLNAKLSFPEAKSGRYDIWVGSYKKGQLPPATLVITELESKTKAGTCPSVGQPAAEFSLSEGFQPDPNVHAVTAGGDVDLGTCKGVPGKGWVTRRPDFVVRYKTKGNRPSAANLTFRLESAADTVLLINDPREKWHFNDDGGKGLNAKLTFRRAVPGRYDVWVGSYGKGQQPKARLIVTEID